MIKPDIRNLSLEELTEYILSIGEKPYRGVQIFKWIYQKGAWSFQSMANLPTGLRERLTKDFDLRPNVVINKVMSKDGTTKFLFELNDKESVESVLIPTAKRTTVCVSSQVGCKMGCKFCASGIGGWKRNLTCAEIITQVLHVKDESFHHKQPLSNIVFMGTGEPLDNFDNVFKAIRIINLDKGMAIGARHITISTSGLIPEIKMLAQQNLQIELAISLHGYDDESRNKLMPVNKKYPFVELIAACREYIKKTHRQITFEYILIKDLTCTREAAIELARNLKGMICKLNLIIYNPVKEFSYQAPAREEILSFQNELEDLGVHAILRTPRGRDIAAACGQLRHETSNTMPKTYLS